MFQHLLTLLLISFGIGALPIVGWMTRLFAHKNLQDLGTGNVGVSAAFYHGGTIVGVMAVVLEAAKGIGVVLLARSLFPDTGLWEQVALMSLVLGRFTLGKGAGTTNLAWGYWVHDPNVSLLVFLLGGGVFLLVPNKRSGKWLVLALLPIVTAVIHPYDGMETGMAMLLSLLMAGIYSRIPDDLNLRATEAQGDSRAMFEALQNSSVLTLDQPLDRQGVGNKAGTLAELRRAGYPVPPGWVVQAGDDPAAVILAAQPSPLKPVVVRSSAVGEDGLTRSAAGQYLSLLNITSPAQLEQAIHRCLQSYDRAGARQYREDSAAGDSNAEQMAVLVQPQITGQFSGVAFSRDPIAQQGEAIVIEALAGAAELVVSGRSTPERYRVTLPVSPAAAEWRIPQDLALTVEGEGQVPERLIERVAYLARHLENYFHGIPQDLEWSYDGDRLWLLQCRPITTLVPIWTRKIAAEVIPGCIRPLTWSINQPLTCGVWGEIFTIVLGNQSTDLQFEETATLHFGHAYFNATLLGEIFQRMGLPPNSLEFLTRGAPFVKPPLASTFKNIPGLWRLLRRELRLIKDFQQDDRSLFQPLLETLKHQPLETLSSSEILDRCHHILKALERATYYSILAPLSFSLRQKIWKVKDDRLDASALPEVAAMRELRGLSLALRTAQMTGNPEKIPPIAEVLHPFLEEYGYLSEVGTDISIPTWKESPLMVESLLNAYLADPHLTLENSSAEQLILKQNWIEKSVQQRLSLKGKVTEIYSKLLAELRYGFVALENQILPDHCDRQTGDIFYLEFSEITEIIHPSKSLDLSPQNALEMMQRIADRRRQFAQYQALGETATIPPLVYGWHPPIPDGNSGLDSASNYSCDSSIQVQGIGASPGQITGRIQRVTSFQALSKILPTLDRQTILVVPYTDSGWAPLLAKAGGLIAEVGGQLSHGAIVAREYGIPAVMNVTGALQRFADGDRVHLDGTTGIIDREENIV